MNPKAKLFGKIFRCLLVMVCAITLLLGDTRACLQTTGSARAQASGNQAAKIPADQLDSLVAPIALYPDPLLAQTLAASTYPLEIIQLQQWLTKNPGLKDKALADSVAKQPWDPSVQALAALPDVVKRLADDVQWTTDLGNAFLAQQSDVMDAVQRMRKKAQDKGNLESTEQQKVETKVIENKSVIVVEQANPQVVYVPSYDPVVVYGAPFYPYPPIYYPPWGYYASGIAISFGVGVIMGAFWSGGWGWGCGWGGNNDITINRNNNFNRNSNIGGDHRRNCRLAGIVTTLGTFIAHPSSQLAAEIPLGSTILNIAAVRRIRIALLRTDLGEPPVVIILQTARLALGNRLADREAICLAIEREPPPSAIEPVVLAIGRAVVELIALEAGIFRAAVGETEMRSVGVPEVPADITGRARGPVETAVLPALALEVEVPVAEVGDADEKRCRLRRGDRRERCYEINKSKLNSTRTLLEHGRSGVRVFGWRT